ncbi:hypothetical protein U0070_008200 [Myodes glareolus]|uniref:Uncharacterized protein n=1 Tax=Myodes glareolus TaxID=447135 RepID=A0AAW0HMF9_MYOGA
MVLPKSSQGSLPCGKSKVLPPPFRSRKDVKDAAAISTTHAFQNVPNDVLLVNYMGNILLEHPDVQYAALASPTSESSSAGRSEHAAILRPLWPHQHLNLPPQGGLNMLPSLGRSGLTNIRIFLRRAPLVPLDARLAPKRFSTSLAPIPGVRLVSFLVLEKGYFAIEDFPAFRAVHSGPGHVEPLVLRQMGVDPEGFPTHLAAVWLLSGVDPLVLPQRRAAAEALVTLAALVGPLPRVDPLVAAPAYELKTKLLKWRIVEKHQSPDDANSTQFAGSEFSPMAEFIPMNHSLSELRPTDPCEPRRNCRSSLPTEIRFP